jgi:hypothetical protein
MSPLTADVTPTTVSATGQTIDQEARLTVPHQMERRKRPPSAGAAGVKGSTPSSGGGGDWRRRRIGQHGFGANPGTASSIPTL